MNTRASLSQFAADRRLVQLDALLQRQQPFNILTALGLSRQELRHSDLLAYLLDPRQPHGLSDRLVRALLAYAVPLLPTSVDAAGLQLSSLTVQREWNFIDILITSPADQLVVVIENKVDSWEHSDQLGRYFKLVQKRWPNWRVVGIFLTLDGTAPESAADRARYAAMSYGDIASILAKLAANPELHGDVQTFLRHYASQIRSVLVYEPDNDTASLARQLYVEHREAFDAIRRARDARLTMVQRCFDLLFAESQRAQPGELVLDRPYTNHDLTRLQIRFALKEWYCPTLEVSTSWTRTKLVVVFEFQIAPQQVHLTLTVGPAVSAQPLRHALYDLAIRQIAPFHPAWNTPDHEWFTIYARDILPSSSGYFTNTTDDAIRATIRSHWEDFLQRDLPVIRATIRHEILGRSWDIQ